MHSIEVFAQKVGQLVGALKGNVAGNLKSLGIKGRKGNAQKCPLARYFIERLDIPRVFVGSSSVVGYDHYGKELFSYALPAEFGQFVSDFDNGKYPELEAELAGSVAKTG